MHFILEPSHIKYFNICFELWIDAKTQITISHFKLIIKVHYYTRQTHITSSISLVVYKSVRLRHHHHHTRRYSSRGHQHSHRRTTQHSNVLVQHTPWRRPLQLQLDDTQGAPTTHRGIPCPRAATEYPTTHMDAQEPLHHVHGQLDTCISGNLHSYVQLTGSPGSDKCLMIVWNYITHPHTHFHYI